MGGKRTKKTVRRACDKIWAEIIRLLYPTCVKCGKPTTEAHHIIGRNALSIRFDLENGIGLCSYCHKFSPFSFHNSGATPENLNVVYSVRDKETLEKLRQKADRITKWNLKDYLDIEINLKAQLEYVKSQRNI